MTLPTPAPAPALGPVSAPSPEPSPPPSGPAPASRLFSPYDLGGIALANRIVVAPMCQYSAHDGRAGDWHAMHLGSLAISGAGLLIVEATAVSPEGRITPGCLGLYDEACADALWRVVEASKAQRPARPVPIAVQLAHAGRKASSEVPWRGGRLIAPEAGGWTPLAPSALPHADGEAPPRPLDAAGLAKVRDDFAAAAERAARIGLDAIELHAAHGYLLHAFLSPLANARDDAYGGGLDARMRFPLEVFDAVRAAVPRSMPVGVRLSATDWVDGGWDVEDSVAFGRELARRGCAWLHVSSGGVSSRQKIPTAPGYQVPLARTLRDACGLPTIAVGLITEPRHAERIVADGDADLVALGRAFLDDPRWPWRAARVLGGSVDAPPQYWRSAPTGAPAVFAGARIGMR